MQRVVRADELRSALASSVLAPSTLVWREGMAGWVPAFTVPELGASDSGLLPIAEPLTDGTTDIGPAPKIAPPHEDRREASDGYAPVPPPPLVVAGKLSPHAHEPGSVADTGRATPTQILNDAGSAQAPANGRGPRPAAGAPAAATPFKIGAAPKPAVAPAARPLGKLDPAAGSAAKLPSARPTTPGGWRKNEGGKAAEEVTLVAEASDPFKLKGPGDSPSNGTSGGAASAASAAAGAGGAKEPSRVASSLVSRRPVTRTALIPGNEPPKPAEQNPPRPAAGRSPSTAPPPAPVVTRKPGSGVPPPPVQVGPRKSPSVAPAARPGATPAPGGASASSAPPADAKGFRTTAFMGTSPGGNVPSAGGISLPAAPRIPSLAKPAFNIVENTSTDSTGVLPLSGHYAAEPAHAPREQRDHGDHREPREHHPSFTDPQEQAPQGAHAQAQAQAHAQAKAQAHAVASFNQARAPQSPQPSYGDAPSGRAHQPSYVEGAPAFAERTPSFPEGAAGLDGAHGAPSQEPRPPLRSHPPPANNAAPHLAAAGSPHLAPGAGSPHASYPPAPQPLGGALLLGAAAGASRMEIEMPVGPIAPGRLGPSYSDGYSTVPGAEGLPYSAPPPPLALGEPAFGEIRTTGALPLVHPKRSLTHGQPLAQGLAESQPPPGYAPVPQQGYAPAPQQGYSNPPLPTSTPPPPGSDIDAAGSLSQPPGKVGDPIVVPMSSLFGAGAMLIAMAVMAFFVGRCSVVPGPSSGPVRVAFAATPRLARASLPTPPKPCWMAKQPVRWAPVVLQSVPVDVAPSASGVTVAYARDAHEPATVDVSFATGAFDDKAADKREGDLVRVFAPRDGAGLLATTKSDAGPLAPYVYATGANPFVIGLAGRGTASPAVAAADKPDGTPVTLWTVPALEDDKGLEAARVLASGPSSYALVFRRSGGILAGYIGEGKKPDGLLSVVAGSGGSVGRPALGVGKREISIVFGDRQNNDAPWEIRVGHAPLGKMPRDTMVVPLPKGGPGGDAFAPDVAGTSDGRWVLVWTEGKSGAYAVRAQTFGADWKPLGDPIAISPPAGNFGQAVVGVAGNYVTTMFLSRASSGSYELWGAVLQCGS